MHALQRENEARHAVERLQCPGHQAGGRAGTAQVAPGPAPGLPARLSGATNATLIGWRRPDLRPDHSCDHVPVARQPGAAPQYINVARGAPPRQLAVLHIKALSLEIAITCEGGWCVR